METGDFQPFLSSKDVGTIHPIDSQPFKKWLFLGEPQVSRWIDPLLFEDRSLILEDRSLID